MNYNQFCVLNESCIKEKALRCIQFSCKCTPDYYWSTDSCALNTSGPLNQVFLLSNRNPIQPVNGKLLIS